MEENTAGLGDGRDDEIDFTFDDHEEETVGNPADHDQTGVTSAENSAQSVNDEAGPDDVLYDEDDDEDVDARPVRDEHPGKPFTIVADDSQYDEVDQEDGNEDEIDYEHDDQPQVDYAKHYESEHGEQHESGIQDRVEHAHGPNDGGGFEAGEFDLDIGNEEYAHAEHENTEPRDTEAEADGTAGEHVERSSSYDSEPANAGPRGSKGDVHQIARDLDLDLGAFENSTPHVLVTWGDDTCPLFKSSDNADPSSYYLDDIEALNYTLTKFLAAMRTNIARWVDDKDEIHVSVDELGMEFSETTTPALLEQVTFQHLVALHEKLVQNDGSETFQTLHLTLTTKKNCALRLGELIQAANSGQGLSAIYSEPTSRASSEPDNYGDNASYDDYHVDGSGEMDEATGLYQEDMDEMGDGSRTLNTDRDESRANSTGASPHLGSTADLAWASEAGVATLLAGSDETRPQQVSTEADDVLESALDQNDMIDYEAEPSAIDSVAAAQEPITEEQLDLINYANDIVSHEVGDGAASKDLLAEMPSFDTAIVEADTGNDLSIHNGEVSDLEAALVPTLVMESNANLVDFTNDLVGADGPEFLGVDDSNVQIETVNEITSLDANLDSAPEAFQLDASHADDEYLEIGAGDGETDPPADVSGVTGTGSATSKVTYEEQQLDPSSHSAASQVNTASRDESNGEDRTGYVAAEDATALHGQPAKDDELDEIDWDDEDKVTAPITPTSATPNTIGKRTRDADEAEDLVDSGHDLKRHRSDQLLS